MKSAYELAMERLQKESPEGSPLSDEQKEALAEIGKRYQAKIAEREIFLNKQLGEAESNGKLDEAEQIKRQIIDERARLNEEMEAEKNKIRNQA